MICLLKKNDKWSGKSTVDWSIECFTNRIYIQAKRTNCRCKLLISMIYFQLFADNYFFNKFQVSTFSRQKYFIGDSFASQKQCSCCFCRLVGILFKRLFRIVSTKGKQRCQEIWKKWQWRILLEFKQMGIQGKRCTKSCQRQSSQNRREICSRSIHRQRTNCMLLNFFLNKLIFISSIGFSFRNIQSKFKRS